MFSEDAAEQDLYHATATVTSLLLEMGEVGKMFCSTGRKPAPPEGPTDQSPTDLTPPGQRNQDQNRNQGQGFVPSLEDKSQPSDDGGETPPLQDVRLEDSSPKDAGTSSAMMTSDDETKDDTSMSSYSVLSAGSHEPDEKLQCEDIADDTVLVRSHGGGVGGGVGPLPHSAGVDRDWAITFEQFLASVLTEQALVRYFEKPVEAAARITNAKNVRKVGRSLSASDYEISVSG